MIRPASCAILNLPQGMAVGEDHPLKVKSSKLTHQYIGPYKVKNIIKTPVGILKLPNLLGIHHTFHFSQLKPVSISTICPLAKPSPSP